MRRRRRAGAAARKSAHVEACLRHPVEYRTRTTGFERIDLPYCALPDCDLAEVETSVQLLGRRLRAPFLIGAMTGGGRHSPRINRNLATAAQRLGVGMMLGSQRIMLEEPAALPSFRVRPYAPDVLLLGNLGVAQLNLGYGAAQVGRAIALVGADGLALHANPLQEALQAGGDGDFRGLAERIAEVAAAVEQPLLLKEVGHGLGADVVRAVAASGLAGLDVAGAGGTSWARVEQYARHGRIVHLELAEWGIPTSDALQAARLEAPGLTLIASGGIRSGVDATKALALGADAVAVALPLLRPALESADAARCSAAWSPSCGSRCTAPARARSTTCAGSSWWGRPPPCRPDLRRYERSRSAASATTYVTPPIAPSCAYGEPSRPCAHSHRHMAMIAQITTSPARAVA